MKLLLFIQLFLMTVGTCVAQSYSTETVEWIHPKVYKARTFTYSTDSVNFIANNCKVFEIRTISGVTGYYVEGDATLESPSKKLMEKCTAALFRFNPSEIDSIISIENIKEIKDDDFVSSSLEILKSTFRHCYHAGMDAIIPPLGASAVNFFSSRIGEVIISQDKKEITYYNFTLRTKM